MGKAPFSLAANANRKEHPLMTLAQYRKIHSWFQEKPWRMTLLRLMYKGLPGAIYLLYPAAALVLLFSRDRRLIAFLAVPAAVFGAVTVLRRNCNFPRPYEAMDLTPLIPKNTKGQSFPSRHCACGAVIATAMWPLSPALGIGAALASLAMAVCRVAAGVHYPRDVAAGLLLGFGCGWVGTIIINHFLPL